MPHKVVTTSFEELYKKCAREWKDEAMLWLRMSRSRWVSFWSNLLLLAVVLLAWIYVLYAGKVQKF
jgi:hypothetical protein